MIVAWYTRLSAVRPGVHAVPFSSMPAFCLAVASDSAVSSCEPLTINKADITLLTTDYLLHPDNRFWANGPYGEIVMLVVLALTLIAAVQIGSSHHRRLGGPKQFRARRWRT